MGDIQLKINEFICSYMKVHQDENGYVDSDRYQINAPEEFLYVASCYVLSCWRDQRFWLMDGQTKNHRKKENSCDFSAVISDYLDSNIWDLKERHDETEMCQLRNYREPENLEALTGRMHYAWLYWRIEADKERYNAIHIYIRCLYYYLSNQLNCDKKGIDNELESILATPNFLSEFCNEIIGVINLLKESDMMEYMVAIREVNKVCGFIKNQYTEDKHSFRMNDR